MFLIDCSVVEAIADLHAIYQLCSACSVIRRPGGQLPAVRASRGMIPQRSRKKFVAIQEDHLPVDSHGQVVLVRPSPLKSNYELWFLTIHRKYEHSKTFGLITSGSSNVVWAADEHAPLASGRQTGAGRAIVGADEDVLCWDVKKGELLSRWRDRECKAEVTTIANSTADPDVYAVG